MRRSDRLDDKYASELEHVDHPNDRWSDVPQTKFAVAIVFSPSS
ncbi:MAG TPA: hypothetical protein VGF18_01600 [Candidatus Tumulicola sp.]